jgi:hypothetical protein
MIKKYLGLCFFIENKQLRVTTGASCLRKMSIPLRKFHFSLD